VIGGPHRRQVGRFVAVVVLFFIIDSGGNLTAVNPLAPPESPICDVRYWPILAFRSSG